MIKIRFQFLNIIQVTEIFFFNLTHINLTKLVNKWSINNIFKLTSKLLGTKLIYYIFFRKKNHYGAEIRIMIVYYVYQNYQLGLIYLFMLVLRLDTICFRMLILYDFVSLSSLLILLMIHTCQTRYSVLKNMIFQLFFF